MEGKARLFALTAASGSLENVTTLVERMEPPFWWHEPQGGPGKRDASLDACVTAARGRHMPVLRFLLTRGYPLDAHATLAAVMRHCDLADALWLLAQEPVRSLPAYQLMHLPKKIVKAAASSTTPEVVPKLEWVFTQQQGDRAGLLRHAARAAAKSDNLAAAQWLLQRAGDPKTLWRHLLSKVPTKGGVAVVSLLADNVGMGQLVGMQRKMHGLLLGTLAAHAGNAALLQVLLPRALAQAEETVPIEELSSKEGVLRMYMQAAAMSGQVDAMQVVRDQATAMGEADPLMDGLTMRCAVESGSVEAVRWVWTQRPEGQALGLSTALGMLARNGNLPLLTFLHDEAGVPLGNPAELLSEALQAGEEGASKDSLAVLRWLEERGCLMQATVALRLIVEDVACFDDAAALQWLHDRGLLSQRMLQSVKTLEFASAVGCEAVVEWLAAAGCPMGRTGGAYLAAGRNGDLDMLRCLKRLGAPWSRQTLLQALEAGEAIPAHAVRWMVEKGGAPCDRRAVDKAGKRYRGSEGAELLKCMSKAAGAGKGR